MKFETCSTDIIPQLYLLSIGLYSIMGKHRMVDLENIVLSFKFIMKVK